MTPIASRRLIRPRPNRTRPVRKKTARPSRNGQFDELLLEHGPRIDALIHLYVREAADFLDARQEVHRQIFRAMPRIDRTQNVSGFLASLTVRKCIDYLKHEKARGRNRTMPFLEDSETLIERDFRQKKHPANPSDNLTYRELLVAYNRVTRKGSSQLTEPQRRMIRFVISRELNGESPDYQELANRFNIPIGTVKSRLHSARKSLQTAMAQELDKDKKALSRRRLSA